MMTLLSALFLILSFPFQGLALAAKTASTTAKSSNIALKPELQKTATKRKILFTKRRFLRRRTNRSLKRLDKLEKRKAKTSKIRFLKRRSLSTKIAKAKLVNTKNMTILAVTNTKAQKEKAKEVSLRSTSLGLKTTELTQRALGLTASATSSLMKAISSIFSLLIPIDIYITIAVLVLVVVSGVVSVIFTNGGIADPNAEQSTITESGEEVILGDSDTVVTEDNEEYKVISDTGWIYFSQSDDRWKSNPHGRGSGDTIGGTGCGTTCTSMVLTHFSKSNTVYTPDKVTKEYMDLKGNSVQMPHQSTGTIPEMFEMYASDVSMKATYCNDSSILSNDVAWSQTICETIDKGGCVIVDFSAINKFNKKNIWTDEGHYVIIYKYELKEDTTGYIYRVLDPNGGHESGSSGIKDWAPYSSYEFDIRAIAGNGVKYFYYVEPVGG